MAWNDPADWPAGTLIDAAFMNAQIRDNLNYLYDAPVCQLTHSTTQSAGSGGEFHVDFDTEVDDPDGMHAAGSSDYIDLSRTGLWWMSAYVRFSSLTATTDAWLRVAMIQRAFGTMGASGVWAASVGATTYQAAAYQVTCQANHHSGGAETLDANPQYGVQWLHA